MPKLLRANLNLSTKPLQGFEIEGLTRQTRLSFGSVGRISIATAVACFVMLNPTGASWQQIGASEKAVAGLFAQPGKAMPRFVSGTQFAPLREALLSYNLNAAMAQAQYSSALPEQPPALNSPPQLVAGGQPKLVHANPGLSTMAFHATLLEARRDAGEARELADEMHRQASAISNHLNIGEIDKKPAEQALAETNETSPPPLPANAPAIMGTASIASEQADEKNKPAEQTFATAAPVDLSNAFKPLLDFARKTVAGVTVAPESQSASAREPLPGRMALGLGRPPQPEAATVSEAANTEPKPAAAVPAVISVPQRNADNSANTEPKAAHRTARLAPVTGEGAVQNMPQRRQREEVSPEAAAAYGFVPLSPPKEREVSPEPELANEPVSDTERPARKVIKRPPAHKAPKAKPPVAILKLPAKTSPSSASTGNESNASSASTTFFSWIGNLANPSGN
ncbi:MAG: hypothetical protein ACK5KM_14590 [Hyphomicrobiaceae bacterium]